MSALSTHDTDFDYIRDQIFTKVGVLVEAFPHTQNTSMLSTIAMREAEHSDSHPQQVYVAMSGKRGPTSRLTSVLAVDFDPSPHVTWYYQGSITGPIALPHYILPSSFNGTEPLGTALFKSLTASDSWVFKPMYETEIEHFTKRALDTYEDHIRQLWNDLRTTGEGEVQSTARHRHGEGSELETNSDEDLYVDAPDSTTGAHQVPSDDGVRRATVQVVQNPTRVHIDVQEVEEGAKMGSRS